MLCYGCGRDHHFPGNCVLHVRGIIRFMEVMFLHVTGSFIVYGSYVLHVVGAHFDRSGKIPLSVVKSLNVMKLPR